MQVTEAEIKSIREIVKPEGVTKSNKKKAVVSSGGPQKTTKMDTYRILD